VDAVKEAWELFSDRILQDCDEEAVFLSYNVTHGTSAMPLSISELMEGASSRAESLVLQLKREKTEADFYIGLEGGFHVIDSQGAHRKAFLESWAYVSDGYKGFFGHGGGLFVPPSISDPVIDRGTELGIVMDRVVNQAETRVAKGTWGILTRDILTRQHSFVIALIAAFAPFYHPDAYR